MFVPAPHHVFKIDGVFFCSYSCFLHESNDRASGKKTHGGKANRPILKISPVDGSVVARYDNQFEAAEHEGVNKTTIGNWLRGKCISKQKFIWRYEDEYEQGKAD